ncbi:MAG: hypothetical protein ACM3X5_02455 [Bacillota bacterium]
MARTRVFTIGALSLAAIAVLLPAAGIAADAERGRQLYEQRCTACHTQSVHKRGNHKARDYNEVREWVERWNDAFNLGWDDEAVEDVTVFLNTTVYNYAVPASSRSPAGAPHDPERTPIASRSTR